MGQKVHPTGIRLGITKDHNSVWYAGKDKYADNLLADIAVRSLIEKRLEKASVSKVVIERPAQNAKVTIHTARPGIVIGKKGEDVEVLRKDVSELMGIPVHINIEEVRKPDLDAKLVAQSVANQLERRVMFRRAMKRAVQNAMRGGAQGGAGSGEALCRAPSGTGLCLSLGWSLADRTGGFVPLRTDAGSVEGHSGCEARHGEVAAHGSSGLR